MSMHKVIGICNRLFITFVVLNMAIPFEIVVRPSIFKGSILNLHSNLFHV